MAIYDRTLSSAEILDIYRRGALRLRIQVRSCDDATCSGETFIGPDGTAGTYYDWGINNPTTLPSFSLSNVDDNRYFQYTSLFETDSTAFSSELNSLTIDYSGSGSDETTDSTCLDLSSELVPYLAEPPRDPKDGSAERTYYAIKRVGQGGFKVVSCSSELSEDIYVQR